MPAVERVDVRVVAGVQRVLHRRVELRAVGRHREALEAAILAARLPLAGQQLLQLGLRGAVVEVRQRGRRGGRVGVLRAVAERDDALQHHAVAVEMDDRRAVLVAEPVAAVARVALQALGVEAVGVGRQERRADRVVARLQVHVVVERERGEVAKAGDRRAVAGERRGLRDPQRIGPRHADLRARDDGQPPVVVGLKLVDRRREAGRRERAAAAGRGRLAVGAAIGDREKAPVAGAGDDLQRRQPAFAQATRGDDRAGRAQRGRRQHEAAVERVAPGLDRVGERGGVRGRRGGGGEAGGDRENREQAHDLARCRGVPGPR